MRVKQLEIFGFKSFAKKTTVHFEPGVTAIVGPNGSGKTNLIDAVRWVLGEHNPRDLRAPRLEDVIFNGTDRLAPISMAEVSLVIDNVQGLLPIAFSEVMITRRVYRSGESECALNGSPCRLKDIQELLLGTGLGGGTYAIIEQGHIDLVLSSKPDERRVVFEEASGVAKYLAKKQETMRRLEETQTHLVRVADIIAEVKRQVSALERSANRARQYQRQWEQVKQLEMRLAADELKANEQTRARLEHEAAALTQERVSLEAQKQEQVSGMERAHAAIADLQRTLQERHHAVAACRNTMEHHAGQLTLKAQWVEALQAQQGAIEAEEAHLRARLQERQGQREQLRQAETETAAHLGDAEDQVKREAEACASLEAQVQQAQASVEAAKGTLFEAASSASACRNQVAEASFRLQALTAHLDRLNERRAQVATQHEVLSGRLQGASKEREGLETEEQRLRQGMAEIEGRVTAASSEWHERLGRLEQLREQVVSERARVAVLEEVWRRFEGFPESVKLLVEQPPEGLIGPLGDLVQPQAGYEELVEAALGPLVEALVVKDRTSLIRCRELLTAQGFGGCRFLVLSDCPTEAIVVESAEHADGVTGAVKQFVQVEPAYQRLVDWLLNDAWVVDDMGRLLAKPGVPQGRLVSARGDRWDRRSWRFGSLRAASLPSRVGRKQRWEEARCALERAEQDAVQLEAQAKQAEEAWQALRGEQEALRGRLADVGQRCLTLESQIAHWSRESEQQRTELKTLDLEMEDVSAQRNQAQGELAACTQRAEEAEARHREAEGWLQQAQVGLEAIQRGLEHHRMARTHQTASVSSLNERLSVVRDRAREAERDELQLHEQLQMKAAQRAESSQRHQALSQERLAHEQARSRTQEELARFQQQVEEVERSLREAEAARDAVLPRLLECEQRLAGVVQQIQSREQTRESLSLRREHTLQRLRELYQINFAPQNLSTVPHNGTSDAASLSEEERASLTEQIRALRAKLEGFGPVSVGTIEEHEELTRRLDFLKTQQQDLLQAKEDLTRAIAQINRTARHEFQQTFERITQEFRHYFTRLFNGGEANLALLDPEHVLESGIDIIARPPGKRLQSISLLSGGERALTAIALLFALFKVRPSPLCILDEIDAPLDEANVDRFTKVLEEFLQLSQFILVTHNKKTITKADSLYGVTMEEPGLSKLISAKLTAPQPEPEPALSSV